MESKEPTLPSAQEAGSLNSVLACHGIKPEQAITFSGLLSPNLQNGEADPSELQGPSLPRHLVEKKCCLRDLVPGKREAWSFSGHRALMSIGASHMGSFSVWEAGQPARRHSHGMQQLEGSPSWGEGHCFCSVDYGVRKLEKGPGATLGSKQAQGPCPAEPGVPWRPWPHSSYT